MMQVFQYSGTGQRAVNQDRILVQPFSDDEALFIVADGMGGYSNGEEAAALVAEAIAGFVSAHRDSLQPNELLHKAIVEANQQLSIRRYAYGCIAMGTVIALALVKGDTAFCTWLGDSRIYHYRNGQCLFVSSDHSALKEWGAKRVLSPAQIQRYANTVTRCVMGDENLGPIEVTTLSLQQGDTLFLCSDGLHKEVNIELLPSEADELQQYLSDNNALFHDNYSIIKLKI